MNTINSLENINLEKESVVTIGNFDGLHLGHLELIKKTSDYAKKNNLNSVVFTFSNHPLNYFKSNHIKNIISNEQKIDIINSLGIDIIINIKFDEFMTKIDKYTFVKDILKESLKAKKIIVGHDFTFAKKKEGNVDTLIELSKEFGFCVEVIDEIKINQKRISSTHIRHLIENGNVNEVKSYLGRNYSLDGIVVHARKLGRTIGFPTANMLFDEKILIPKGGIYASKVFIDDKVYFGATNIGFNPTVNGNKLSIETNIINFNEDIYDKRIKVEFLERIRDEKKFNSLDELKNQLKKDIEFVWENYLQ
ncbi:MAG: bifunctional riboflavin kinase/FAD synthetase [Peptostreptococcaceae bacterium]